MTEDPLSVDYWIKHNTFGIDKKYKVNPDYIEAQQIWSSIKCFLYETFKDKLSVVEFINSIEPLKFHEKDDCYTIIGVIKMNYTEDDPQYNYKHFSFNYDPIMLVQKQITLTDYDGFVYDMGMFMKYDYMLDTEDQTAIDKELFDDFRKMTGYIDVGLEDISTILNAMLSCSQ